MSDDFIRLVSQANPATRYQPANNGYPPTSSPPNANQPLDPFFDEEDEEDVPSSAFGNVTAAMRSQESGIPLARAGAPPAGLGSSQVTLTGTIQPDWLDDDEQQPSGLSRPPASSSASGSSSRRWRRPSMSFVKRWRWPWDKRDRVLTGERLVVLNNPIMNSDFGNNYVSTSKYNLVTFVPKFLFEQFSKYANLFFLFTALIQQIPNVSPTNRWTTIAPLSAVILASAFKETQEDIKRHQSDSELNSRTAKVLTAEGTFVNKKWKHIAVGDVIRIESDDPIPADLILLSSSEPEGFCYIETSNLDGETNLKIKQASPQTAHLTAPHLVTALYGKLRSEHPNNSLYTYEGTLELTTNDALPKQVPLGPDQLLLRGAQMRNTPWAYGLVVFTGHETKLMRNATAAPIKRTAVERQVNVHIIFLFMFLVALSLGSTIGSSIRTWFYSDKEWYLYQTSSLGGRAKQFVEDILTFIILYNNLIPISLIVTMEIVKFQQAQLINSDLDMYYAKTDTPALCRTSSLVEELGQIEYVFSDKTGTLTRNEMEFRFCTIGGVAYADVVEESKRGDAEDGKDGWRSFAEMRALLGHSENPFSDVKADNSGDQAVVNEFLTLLAVCHTVIPEIVDGKMRYQASSPDEAALVAGAELLGYQFHTRKPKSVFVNVNGQSLEYQILNVCEFNSTRKRMSTVVRCPDGKVKLYCKGADTVILERLSEKQPFTEKTLMYLEEYATEGLRTLCIAFRDIPEAEYRDWVTIYEQAATTINGRGEALDKAAELIEKDLFLLGATAIEDKLQDGVPDTIHTLQMAGIKVWVLTGDRQETAINIGMSCRLISESMNLIIVNEETMLETQEFITKRLSAIKNQRSTGEPGELEDLALIIDGKSLGFALEKEIALAFLELALMCKAVICCRVSPLQKAQVVKLVKKNQKSILLAIGDGANDVSMIQAAHVGVGISGLEGLQAARSADVAISQFRHLKKLLLVHGAWSYQRLSKLLLYSFYKNIVLYMTQFWYSFFNSFSGESIYESWTLSMYNVVFTLLPPFVIGIFDQFVSARILDRYPQLYMLGQKNVFFTKTAFWLWIANAFYHSIVLFGFSVILFWGDLKQSTGYDSGHWFWGTALYLAVLLTVLGKAALISDLWTKYTVAAIPGSFVFAMVFLPIYAVVAPAIGFSTEYYGLVPRLWSDAAFYFMLILIPIFCLTRDFVWKYYRRTYNPQTYHIAQEIQKYNIPDYRPRQEQFQKAIKKVRAVQRMRRNRGFAFSQTENAARQDQTRVIRAYDTSRTGARPSGY
ncbi:phospholipid-translocating P-type ATPase [Laetiporus sulphureus 93-53]|uniref:Phospholipid-transporting ATPase n=1 Tax=Laetiporus sulphureus 93-53 TaxID=1314785 RepID=A0A165DFM6_9APHY|nr:phospholipid-translocating P-type ATPase [Laetiporus sulphureus 93-53]KZT04791.1 phospholipid-translocating P-type ATPase [Laetiporus sulphureus 93-53]